VSAGASGAVYVATLLGSVLVYNADAENNWPAFALAAAGSIAFGWIADRPGLAVLAVVAVPFSLPFGYADEYLGSDAPRVWWFGVAVAVISAALIVASAWTRRLTERGRNTMG
jgi:hypothetical protein